MCREIHIIIVIIAAAMTDISCEGRLYLLMLLLVDGCLIVRDRIIVVVIVIGWGGCVCEEEINAICSTAIG